MTYHNKERMIFPPVKNRKVEVQFNGGDITSDGGVMLLREIDRELSLTKEAAKLIKDPRQPKKITHSILSMLRQRIYGIALGYEDVNDHDSLRHDIGIQSALEIDKKGSSSPTLCRFEKYANRKAIVGFHRILLDRFVASFKKPPKKLILDFDATDNPVHGKQEGRFFHGYYDHYCFLPLYVFCGKQLLVSYLRPSNQDAAKHAWSILALLVKALRRQWPEVKIIFRADSGFCRHRIFNWCERHQVGYIVGIARNDVLEKHSLKTRAQAALLFLKSEKKQRLFNELFYAAGTWKTSRRILVKAEVNPLGPNTRYVVTNLKGDPQKLYDKLYCTRGNLELSIGEQISFYSDRTSCHQWWANQFRLMLSSFAYVLIETLRRVHLKRTILKNARCRTICEKLLRIGAVLTRNTRRVRLMLSESYPHQRLFWTVYRKLCPG